MIIKLTTRRDRVPLVLLCGYVLLIGAGAGAACVLYFETQQNRQFIAGIIFWGQVFLGCTAPVVFALANSCTQRAP